MEITIGAEYTAETTVDGTNIASAVGSGLIDVFATPMMVALMELAASQCIKGFLAEGQASVGTQINVSHTNATLPGRRVTATARVTAVDRRRVDFAVTAYDEAGEIGSGTHTRFIIDTEKFLQKAQSRI